MAFAVKRDVICLVLLSVISTLTYGHYVVDSVSMHQLAYDLVDENATENVQDQTTAASSYQNEGDAAATSVPDGLSQVYQEKYWDNMRFANDELKKNVEMSTLHTTVDPMEADIMSPGEAVEPSVVPKKTYCLGCATQVDIDISPENREAVEKMGEEIVKRMDEAYIGRFIHARPNILSVEKQVELGIKYTITFESRLSSCLKGDNKKRSECAPQEEFRICVAELVKKLGKADEVVSNNCTDIDSPLFLQSSNIPVMKTNNEVLVSYENVPAQSPLEGTFDISQESLESMQSTNARGESDESNESTDNISLRPRRGTNVGALKDVGNDEKDLISQFAQLAVRTLDEVDPDDNKRVVLRVVEAKKQIVNGIMYHLVLHVASSNCPETEDSYDDSSFNCLEDQLHPEKICRVQIHRSWAGESSQNAKVVKSECADLWLDGAAASGRSGRSNSVGDDENWVNDDDWKKYDMQDRTLEGCLHEAVDSLHNILLLDDVSKVATMMDAHTRTNKKTKEQELAVMVHFPQPRNLKVTEDIEKPVVVGYRVTCSRRQRRSPGVAGGLSHADENDENVKKLITFGLGEIEKTSNSPYRLLVTKVIEVKTQVVAGRLLHVKLEVAPSSCLKSDSSNAENCPLAPANSNEGRQVCFLKIWEQPWLNHKEVTELKCEVSSNGVRRKRETLLGAPTSVDVKDKDVQDLAEFALPDIHKSINSLRPLKVARIVEARKQIVSGTLTHLKVEVSPSACPKDENCALAGNEGTVTCNFRVYEQSWTNTKEVQGLQCEPTPPTRSKREILVGAPVSVDTEDQYVQELANFAVFEMDKGTNSPYQQKVIKVTEAKKQLVNGILMHLKMELGYTSCRKGESNLESCHVNSEEKQVCSLKVYDLAREKRREVQDVQCGTVRTRRSFQSNGHVTSDSQTEVDVNDPYIIESAWYAVHEMDRTINSPFHRRLERIVHASVEHGELTTVKLHLKVSVSSCRKNPSCGDSGSTSCRQPAAGSPECPSQDGAGKYICSVEIKHRPWLQQRYLKSSKCSNMLDQQHTQKNNHLIGGDDHDYHAGIFREFLHRYNKTYPSDFELKKRFHIFRENLKLIKELQAGEQGTAVYGPTMFADLAPEEFKQKYLGLRRDLRQENAIPMRMATIPNVHLPESFDWRDHNIVTPVKNQGACGSCWAFAVTGNLEGQYALKYGKLLSFSEQELVDCDTLDDGCKGGLFENAYHSIEKLGGLETESDYPYEGYDDQCHFNSSEVQVQLSSSVNITTNETQMAQWLVKNGPIAIGINANAMQFYMGGVSHPFKFLCSPSDLDHGVLIVGYGVHTYPKFKKVLPFWIIKNSWGERWGEQGYYRVYRGDGTCGVNQMASSGIVA